jgi:signal transduction histidine kinase
VEDRLEVLVHELRSPVAALVALAEAFPAERDAPEGARRMVELAVAAGRTIERLVCDQDAFSIEPRAVELGAMLEGLTRGRAELDAEPGLVVVADPVRLRQALVNLLDNAVRHGDTVVVTARSSADGVEITVSDDGPGVPPGLDVFASGVSGAGSTGHGLAVVHAVAARHGGTIELVEANAPGASFRLVLPSGGG